MNPYFEQTILNADPTELIKMVYQRAISCVRDAREHLRHKRIAERSAAIMRAYAALTELLAALRSDVAPDLAERLQNLYFYMQRRLVDANLRLAVSAISFPYPPSCMIPLGDDFRFLCGLCSGS